MDPYQAIADFYDLEHQTFQDDIDFYLQLIDEGPVLEVGVGTGRIAAPLAAEGLAVWGVDDSPAMLSRAAVALESYPNVHLIAGSVLELELDVRFRAVLWPLNALWHLSSLEDQQAALSVVHRHLRPFGMLVIDLSNPLTMADRGARGNVRERFRHLAGDTATYGFSSCWDDDAEQLLSLNLMYDVVSGDGIVRRTPAMLELRYLYRGELQLLLENTGFEVRQIYGSYDLEPYSAQSPNLLAVAVALPAN